MRVGELCRRLGVPARQLRYVLEEGHRPPGVADAPGRGDHRELDPAQTFWLAVVLALKQTGVRTPVAARLADRILSACREAGFEAKIAARSGQWDFMAELVAARVGLAFLPRPLCERLSRERFGWIPLVEPRIMWRLAFVWLRDGYLSHAARAFLDMLKTNYPPSPTGKAPR